ncbi:membrane protein insertase YidC [Arenicella sp. 4NH20-0111]|uniref:membrane protein insertase YidC n=1 Tax=Arenicella sp. 4NH20-0111 TaxID=3127648 RepID=UPI003340108A
MENQRNLLLIGLLTISMVLYLKWLEFSKSTPEVPAVVEQQSTPVVPQIDVSSETPQTPQLSQDVYSEKDDLATDGALIRVETDLVIATINTIGATIERLELKQELASRETPDQGFVLLKNEVEEKFIVEDGLLIASKENLAPTHRTPYQYAKKEYNLGDADQLNVPLTYIGTDGIRYTKNLIFKRDSYVIDINYTIDNTTSSQWSGFFYGQFRRTEPAGSGGGFGQLPSYTGGAYYTVEDKYKKYDFGDMQDENLKLEQPVEKSWVAMLQHYFVGAFIPSDAKKELYSLAGNEAQPNYRIGYRNSNPHIVAPNSQGTVGTQLYVGPKTQYRLKALQEQGFTGLARTVDYGFLTVIADPLFWLLEKIHDIVGNWGWAIILLTVLIKAAFFKLSDKSGKSMAAMKKIQPRLQTLKERYKDDRQKFQMEMMALYKKEKINPAGGCLPILVQMPVFFALYWVLLESVELRQAPFALWLQDLSAPDPYYILPVLMGVTQFIMFKLNPAPMEDIQKKVFMIMPIVFIFIFATFPQGLVLYWVVNNILSMAQQWYINRKYAV